MNDGRSRLWWSEIAGPSAIVRSVVDTLLRAKSVILFVPEDLPWRHQMRDAVELLLRQDNDSLQVSYVDCQTDCALYIKQDGSIDIPNFLIRQFGLSEFYNGYRKSSNCSIQNYIINKDVLRDRIVWVKGMDRCQVDAWCEFCRDFKSNRTDKGLFIIESYQDVSLPASDSISAIRYSASYYDALLFNNMIVSATSRSLEWMQYIATLSAQLCREDVELSASFIMLDAFDSEEPIQGLSDLAFSPEFKNRKAALNLREDHPFTLIRNGDMATIGRKLWESQLKILYPLLEMERVSFIKAFENAVREAIGCEFYDYYGNRHHVSQFGEILNDPYETEIGTLFSMSHMKRANDPNSFVLYLPDEAVRNRLSLLHDMRNSIAHINVCTFQQVTDFLNGYPNIW